MQPRKGSEGEIMTQSKSLQQPVWLQMDCLLGCYLLIDLLRRYWEAISGHDHLLSAQVAEESQNLLSPPEAPFQVCPCGCVHASRCDGRCPELPARFVVLVRGTFKTNNAILWLLIPKSP